MKCICDFPLTCAGTGTLDCIGCGGDFCICRACFGRGELECDGCAECRPDIDWDGESDIGAGDDPDSAYDLNNPLDRGQSVAPGGAEETSTGFEL